MGNYTRLMTRATQITSGLVVDNFLGSAVLLNVQMTMPDH